MCAWTTDFYGQPCFATMLLCKLFGFYLCKKYNDELSSFIAHTQQIHQVFFSLLLYLNNIHFAVVCINMSMMSVAAAWLFVCVVGIIETIWIFYHLIAAIINLIWGPLLQIRKILPHNLRKKTHWEFNDSTGSRIVIYNWPSMATFIVHNKPIFFSVAFNSSPTLVGFLHFFISLSRNVYHSALLDVPQRKYKEEKITLVSTFQCLNWSQCNNFVNFNTKPYLLNG